MNILIIKSCYIEKGALPLTLESLNRGFMNEKMSWNIIDSKL